MKLFRKALACVLCITMLLTVMPLGGMVSLAENTLEGGNSLSAAEPYIVKELTERRGENTKYFLMSDRSIKAAMYPAAVHYLENGTWVDVDNSFSLVEDEALGTAKENRKGSFKVKFASKAKKNGLVSLKKDSYKIDWSLLGANKVDLFSSEAASAGSSADVLGNITSKAAYADILTGVDLEYIVNATGVKENIILKDSTAAQSFTFNYKLHNLSYRLNEDNTVDFYDKNHPKMQCLL